MYVRIMVDVLELCGIYVRTTVCTVEVWYVYMLELWYVYTLEVWYVYKLELWHDYSIYTTILPEYIQDVYSFVAVYDMAYYSHTIVLV